MSQYSDSTQRIRKSVLVVLAIGITSLFLWMISDFLMALLVSAIASGGLQPLYHRLARTFRNRKRLAAGATVFIVLVVLVVPATLLAGIVTSEALELSRTAGPWLADQFSHPGQVTAVLERYPILSPLLAYKIQIGEKAAEVAGTAGAWVVDALATAARETLTLLLMVFITLYSMFFFLVDGRKILWRILYYLPLTAEEEGRMVDRFLSVARATIRGTIAMGLLQGALGGLAFFLLDVPRPALWTTMMIFLSMLPGVGSALVWIPAALYLFINGHDARAIILAVWFAGFVGTIDNVLRPRLIGKDIKMSDLLILVATLGGIVLFGIGGFVLGPIVAALLVTVWDIYGEVFADILPAGSPELLESKRGVELERAMRSQPPP
jgi:predicted PurR-regulated permease PerM